MTTLIHFFHLCAYGKFMILDVIIGFTLLLFAYRSYRGGLQGEIYGAMGWLLTILLAIALSDPVASIITQISPRPELAKISQYLAFLIVILLTRALSSWIVRIIPNAQQGKPGLIMTLLAIASGAFKGAFIVSVILLFISRSSLHGSLEAKSSGSMLYAPTLKFSNSVVKFILRAVPDVDQILQRLSTTPPRQ